MKNLRQMLRSTGLFGSKKRSPRQQPATSKKRRLLGEALERRELLAGDVSLSTNPFHNGLIPYDVNNDREVTALDALLAINNLGSQAEGEDTGNVLLTDVNNDGESTALDVLAIINGLPDAEGENGLVELLLTARDLNDDPLPVTNGVVEVDVNEEFLLEVAFNDLRTFGADIGVFQLITDLGVSTNGVLTPVLNEAQLLSFDGNLRTPGTSGNFVFSLEDSPLTFTSDFTDFADAPAAEITNALLALGYEADQFDIDVDTGTDLTDPIIVEIRYTDFDEFGNIDLPNIAVADNLTVSAPVTFTEIAPFNPDGTVNSDAVPFNLLTNSRTFNNDSELFNAVNQGNFNDTDPNLPEGFFGVGGLIGQIAPGGIPDLTGGALEEPFDAYSLRVFLNQPINGFEVNVATGSQVVDNPANPGTILIQDNPEAVLVFGSDVPVPLGEVVLDEDSIVTFNVVNPDGGNNLPIVAQALTSVVNEQDATSTFDLTQFASDPDGDILNVDPNSFSNTGGNAAGITLNGNSVTIDPSAYDALNTGQTEVVTFSFNLIDGNGGTVAQTLSVTINGFTDVTNSNPVVSAAVAQTFNEDDDPAFVDLLAGASDIDGDNLIVSNVTLVSGDDQGIEINEAANTLSVTPQDYGGILDLGDTEVVVFSYTIIDGNGGSVAQTATVTIIGADDLGVNTAPDAGGPINATFTEDDANNTVNLLANAFDIDGDVLTATATLVSGDDSGITIVGNTLAVTPNSYNSLPVGESVVVTYDVSVSDGTASDATTAVVTITGVNDAPVVSGPIAQSFLTTDASTTINLLTNASDVDGDVLSVINSSIVGDASGLAVNGNSLTVTPALFTSLAAGASTTSTVNYQVSDGNGGLVNQSATITITAPVIGNNSPVVSAPVSATVAETAPIFNLNLLQNASDADNDILNVEALTLQSGDAVGVTINGNSLTVDPSAYTALNSGQSEVITFIYNVVDGNGGSVAQTATITITGVDAANTVTIAGPVTASFSEDAPVSTVNLLAGANSTAAPLSVSGLTLLSGDDSGITINGNTLTVDPNAYNSLNAGQNEVISFSYNVTNGTDSVAQTAVITIIGANDGLAPGSSISGALFIDHIENFLDVTQGAAPIRNGINDADEPGLSGVTVTLTSASNQNDTGAAITASVLTELDGSYAFTGVAPGTYTVTYEIPDGVVFLGSTSGQVVVGSAGSAALTGPSLGAISLGSALSSTDILASSYLAANQDISIISDGGAQGGQVALDQNGNQELFVASLGLDGVRFAELALNAQQDAALLTIIGDDGSIESARLSDNQFVVSNDGLSVQFFGGLEDFDFAASPDDLLTQEFENFRNAIDQLLAGIA